MDAGLFIEPFAVGIDGACSAADLFCTLTGTQPAGKCFTYLKLFDAQLGIALQKSLIVCQINFLFSQMRQTADLSKGIIELPLHVLCLTAHIFYLPLQVLFFIDKLLVLRAEMVGAFLDVMLLCFQMRDGLLVEAQSCGDGPQLVKGHLRTAAVCLFEQLDVPHDGAKVAAGIVETADHAEEQQQQPKADNLQCAFQQNLVIVASGEHHSQRMRLCISAGCQKRLGKPYKGELGSAVGGESLSNALFRQNLIRHEAEAVGGIGNQALGNIQSFRTVRQEAGKAVKNSGLSENKLRTVRKQFEKLGVQPATLRDTAGVEELRFVL